MSNSQHKISDFWSMGTAIGLCGAIGVVLGALMDNVTLWLCIGAGVGVVLGAVTHKNK
jgi:hypothetical protein